MAKTLDYYTKYYGESDDSVKQTKRKASRKPVDDRLIHKQESWTVRAMKQTDWLVNRWLSDGRCPCCREDSGIGVTCGEVECMRAWIKGRFPRLNEIKRFRAGKISMEKLFDGV